MLFVQICQCHFVARTLGSQYLLQLSHLRHFLSVNSSDDIALLETGISSCTIILYFGDIHTFIGTEVHFLILLLLHIDVSTRILSLYTNKTALNTAILFKIGYHLIHYSSRNGESVTDVWARRRGQHSIDADEFTTRIDESTARVALIDGCIGLYERLNTIGTQRTSLCWHYTCCHRCSQVERVTDGEYPLAHLDIIAWDNLDGRQVLSIYFDECQVGILVRTDDTSRKFTIVIQSDSQFVSTIHNVVICYDVAIGWDNDATACALLLRSLYLTLLTALTSLSEESEWVKHIAERIVLHLYLLHFGVLEELDVYYTRQSLLCCYCKV